MTLGCPTEIDPYNAGLAMAPVRSTIDLVNAVTPLLPRGYMRASSLDRFGPDELMPDYFSDDVLPTNLDLGDFSSAVMTVFGDSGPSNPLFSVSGSISSLTVVPIPIPASLPLFVSGLLAFGLVARRRRRQA